MTNRYTEAVKFLEEYINRTAEDLCKDNQTLIGIPSKLEYCIEILKALPEYKGE